MFVEKDDDDDDDGGEKKNRNLTHAQQDMGGFVMFQFSSFLFSFAPPPFLV